MPQALKQAASSWSNWRLAERDSIWKSGMRMNLRGRESRTSRFHIIYASVNVIRPGVRARTKSAIGAIRHLFLEADQDGAGVVARLASHPAMPTPSYLLESSPNRVDIFCRVAGFTNGALERLQKHLALHFRT